MTVELLLFAGCPHVPRAREVLARAIARLGHPVSVRELDGDYPSPSIRVDGVDVMGDAPVSGRACRLDAPTEERVLDALRRALGRPRHEGG